MVFFLFEQGGDGGDSEEVTASNHWILPSSDFIGLWENLIYEDGIKEHVSASYFPHSCLRPEPDCPLAFY